ncbi:MAG TPA: hypothetical protein VFB72_18495, partial [Verrucomicrobiae bacterium]|nr:hypothetical protein [Verrucomicrobiae bacterium]
MNQTTQHFTAAQIARALGRKRQAIARALADVRADGNVIVSGQTASAWSFCALPVAMQRQLEQTAERRGYRNPEALLADDAPQLGARSACPIIALETQSQFKELLDAICAFKNPG